MTPPGATPAAASAGLARLHTERGDVFYRHLRRLLAGASASQLDAACREAWRRSLAHPRADPWLTLLRQGYLVAAEHEARRHVPTCPVIAPEQAVTAHAGWMAMVTPPAGVPVTDAHELTHWRRLGDEVVAAIAELPLHHRAAILLHHDLMLPMADIALILQQAPQTVGAMVWTALLHLRARIGAGQGTAAHD